MRRFGPSIFGRFGLTFVLLVALPSLILLFSLSRLAVSSLYEATASQARETGGQILKNLGAQTEILSYQLSALFYDQDLGSNIEQYARAGSEPGRAVWATRIDRNLINFFNFTNKSGTLAFLTKGAGWYSYGNLRSSGVGGAVDEALAAEARADRGRVIFSDRLSGDILTAALSPGPGEDRSEVQLMVLSLRVPFFDDLKAPGPAKGKTEVVLLGRRGQVLLSTLPGATLDAWTELRGQGTVLGDRTVTLAGSTWLTSGQTLDATGWTLVTLRNEADLTADYRSQEPWILGGMGLMVLLFLGYAALFFSGIAKPIQEVVRSMNLVGEGSWGIRAPQVGLGELTVLVDSFNRMSGEIVRLNHERVTVELDALRHQINPHFVANTLNVIKLMAGTARLRSVEQMTGDLMVLLSDSYTGGASLTELSTELRNIESYVRIMKVRHDIGFTLAVDVPPEALDALTLRMLLQPLVENSILHGFAGLDRPGVVTLRARIEDAPGGAPEGGKTLVLEVEDNGVGMDPAVAAQPLADPLKTADRLARIGLGNVDRRLRLHFGEASGLVVESTPGVGTLVRLTLPVLRRAADA